ncbi:hypothetical protein CTI12_AA449440 [Artemisia annua]|uniref:Uncharacterized protein n=1 Tax=Artemisia annua TaxID=35608 RepID=A0A2U1LVK9_ARTAN|nr:hypothetical protein CTI12_AA449440 [Artemisia annua]
MLRIIDIGFGNDAHGGTTAATQQVEETFNIPPTNNRPAYADPREKCVHIYEIYTILAHICLGIGLKKQLSWKHRSDGEKNQPEVPNFVCEFSLAFGCAFWLVRNVLPKGNFDETGTASLVLFEKDCKNLLDGTSAYQLLATQERNGKQDEFPANFNRVLGNKYAFKINIDEWQSKKLLPSSTVQKMSGDPEIINALIPMITPSKGETSDAAMKDKTVSPLETLREYSTCMGKELPVKPFCAHADPAASSGLYSRE